MGALAAGVPQPACGQWHVLFPFAPLRTPNTFAPAAARLPQDQAVPITSNGRRVFVAVLLWLVLRVFQ
jgi:hypothetical protein